MLDNFLRLHDGVITLEQARIAGLSQDAVDRRVRAGRWRRCAPGVYFAEDHSFTDAARVRAAVWTFGSDAVATGITAAWWYDLVPKAPGIVEVTVARGRRLRQRPGIRLRRRDLPPADIVEYRGLRVTSLSLTAIEAAVRPRGNASIVDRALQGDNSVAELWSAHVRNKGRHGSPRARILLQATHNGARSEGERLLIRLLVLGGIEGWVANHPIGPYVGDVVFDAERVVIEVDGLAFHTDTDRFHADRTRQNYLVLNGWQVLRFTWRDLTEHPDRVIAAIRRAICGA